MFFKGMWHAISTLQDAVLELTEMVGNINRDVRRLKKGSKIPKECKECGIRNSPTFTGFCSCVLNKRKFSVNTE